MAIKRHPADSGAAPAALLSWAACSVRLSDCLSSVRLSVCLFVCTRGAQCLSISRARSRNGPSPTGGTRLNSIEVSYLLAAAGCRLARLASAVRRPPSEAPISRAHNWQLRVRVALVGFERARRDEYAPASSNSSHLNGRVDKLSWWPASSQQRQLELLRSLL